MKYEINFQKDGQQYPTRVAEFQSKQEAQKELLKMVNYHFGYNCKFIAQAVAATRNFSYDRGFVRNDTFCCDTGRYYITEVEEGEFFEK